MKKIILSLIVFVFSFSFVEAENINIWNLSCEKVNSLDGLEKKEYKEIKDKEKIKNFLKKYNLKNNKYVNIKNIEYSSLNSKDVKYVATTVSWEQKVMMNNIYLWDNYEIRNFEFLKNDTFFATCWRENYKWCVHSQNKRTQIVNYWKKIINKKEIEKFLKENNVKWKYTEIKSVKKSIDWSILTFVWKKENWKYVVDKNNKEWKEYRKIERILYSPDWKSINFLWTTDKRELILVLDNLELWDNFPILISGFWKNNGSIFFYWKKTFYPRTYYIIKDWIKEELKELSWKWIVNIDDFIVFSNKKDYFLSLKQDFWIFDNSFYREQNYLLYNWEIESFWNNSVVWEIKDYWNKKWFKIAFNDSNKNKFRNYICEKEETDEEKILKLKNIISKKIVLKLEKVIIKLSKEKLIKIYKKIDKINLEDKKYAKYKNILEYFKLRILLEIKKNKLIKKL